MQKFLYLLLLLSTAVHAEVEMKEGQNYCHDPEALKSINGLLADNPNDEDIIKAVALRAGLCTLVDEKKITLDQAIDIFQTEKTKLIVERGNKELTTHASPRT